jgi:hypothetical protein
MVNNTNMRGIVVISLLSCTLLLSGCFPLMGHYYSASTDGGRPSQQDCGGRTGPKTNVTFERGGVRVLVTPYQDSSSLRLTVQFNLQTEDRVVGQWSDMEAIGNSGNKLSIALKSIHGYRYSDPQTHVRYALDVVDNNDFNGENYNIYSIETQIAGDVPDKFTLVIPQMTVNGVVYPTTNISFDKQFGWWMQFINC